MDVRTRKIRVTFFYLVVVSLFIVSSSVLVYYLIQQQLIGQRAGESLFSFFRGSSEVPGISAAVLHSGQTASFLASSFSDDVEEQMRSKENYRDIIEFWHNFLQQRHYESTVIEDYQILTELDRYNLLILPFSHCLSDEQIDAIKFFLEQRKGVIIVHNAGNRDENGKERPGWSLTSDVLGSIPIYPEYRPGAWNTGISLAAQSPLTVGLSPGLYFDIITFDQPMALRKRDPRLHTAAFWERGEDELTYPLAQRASVAHGKYLGGRFAWIGFSPHSVQVEEDWTDFNTLLENMTLWTSYRTLAGKELWPDHDSAATFAILPENNYAGALSLQGLFIKHGIRPVIFAGNNEAAMYRIIMNQILPASELGARIEDRYYVSQELPDDWDRRLKTARTEFGNLFGVDVSGFMIESSKGLRNDVISRIPMEYVWVRNEKDSPLITGRIYTQSLFRRPREPIYIFQSGMKDIRPIQEDKDSILLLEELKRDFDSVHRLGGLYSIAFPSQLIGFDSYRDVLDEFLEYVKSHNTWIAQPLEISRYWRIHDNVKFKITESRGRTTLMITNNNRQQVPETVINIYPLSLPDKISIRAERINVPLPVYRLDRENQRIVLPIRDMNSGESRTYYIEYN